MNVTTQTDSRTIAEQVAEEEAAALDGNTLDELIASEIAAAEQVNDPQAWKRSQPVEGMGDSDAPVAVQSTIRGNNYVRVYDTQTGDPSNVHRNMLPAQLKRRLPNGERAFTTRDPGFRPSVGTLKCWLHAEHEMRPVADEMGMATCKKANIPSTYAVELHMQHRHSQEWRSFEQRRERIEREEQRELQRATLAAMGGRVPSTTPVVPRTIEEGPVITPQGIPDLRRANDIEEKPAEPTAWVQDCADCGKPITSKDKNGHTFARMHHKRRGKCVQPE